MTQNDGSSPTGAQALDRLAVMLREEGGLMASLVESVARTDGDGTVVAEFPARPVDERERDSRKSPARVAAAGPRAEGRREEYELLVEAIYEGYLLHYGVPRVVRPPDADLALLAGDRLYAIGLSRLVAIGDSDAVAELADTITLSALAHGAGDEALAAAVWDGGAHAVGWGSSAAHGHAKELVLSSAPEAIEAMRTSAAGLSDTL
jgi:hypothetical protein